MNIEFKDVYYFVGSTLGIATFFLTITTSLATPNQQKWEKVKEVVTENDLSELENEVWNKHRIYTDSESSFSRITRFTEHIRMDADYLKFGPLYGAQFRRRLQNFLALYQDFRSKVSADHWDVVDLRTKQDANTAEDVEKVVVYALNKNSFGDRDDYVPHLEETASIIEKMRVEFRSLAALANLHPIEVPFRWLIVPRRAKLPKTAQQ